MCIIYLVIDLKQVCTMLTFSFFLLFVLLYKTKDKEQDVPYIDV